MNTSQASDAINDRASVHFDLMTKSKEGMNVGDAAGYIMPIVSLARTIVLAKAHGKAGPGTKGTDPPDVPPTRPADAYVALLNAGGLVLAATMRTHVGDRTGTVHGDLAVKEMGALLSLGRAMARQVLNGKSTIDVLDMTENLIEGNAKHREMLTEVGRGLLIVAYLTVAAERVPT